MASYLVQSGSNLYSVTQAGVATLLTLPTGITLYGSTQPCRIVLFGATSNPVVVVVQGGTHDFWIDSAGTARKLALSSPTAAPVGTAGAVGGLNGVYATAVTFKVKDSNGITIQESGMGPISSGSASLVNQSLRLDKIPVSGEPTVNCRGIYRTLSGGSTLYPWFDIDNNTTLSADRGVVDSLISILPTTATRYGSPPDLKLIVSWRDRLWGIGRTRTDFLRWTEERQFYGWSQDNEILIPPQQTDAFGATAFIPRRDQLGIARRDKLYQVTGFSNDTFQRNCISETIGCVSQESVVVVRNVAYFLGTRGVVEWGQDGLGYVSEAQVDAWFNSDTYFNRSQFANAQGRYNPTTDCYELLLPSVGQTTLNRWVAYDLTYKRWLGPNLTSAFTPTCAGRNSDYQGFILDSSSGTQPTPVFGGSDGFLYKRDETTADDNSTAAFAVAMIADLPYLFGTDPDSMTLWLDPTVHVKKQSAGTLSIIPTIGDLDASAGATLSRNMTLDRERLSRLGTGRYCQLSLQHSTVGESVRIYGIDLPFTRLGRR